MSKYSDSIPADILESIGWFYDDIKPNSTFLDFGCSTGYYGAFVRKNKSCKVYGVEISDDKYEAEKVLDGVYSFDIDNEWPKEVYERKYDGVWFGDVIEHLKYPDKALERSKELLNKGGKIYVSTPNIAHISIRLELLGGNFQYEPTGILDDTHLKYFTLDSLKRLCISAGFDIIKIDYSLRDYPRGVVTRLLDACGVEAHERFWKLLSDPTARAYQYRLVLAPAKKGMKKISAPDPIVKPEQYKTYLIDDLHNQIKQLKADTKNKEKLVKKELQNNKKLLEALEDIRNSRTYKAARILAKTKQKIKRAS